MMATTASTATLPIFRDREGEACGSMILSRVERLDLMMGQLEEVMKGSTSTSSSNRPELMMRNSYSGASTTSSGTASDGGNCNSSANSSPKSSSLSLIERRCRPLDDAVMETRVKGTLIDRVVHLETRLVKLVEDVEKTEKRQQQEEKGGGEKKKHKKGLKSIVKSCVRGDLKTKD